MFTKKEIEETANELYEYNMWRRGFDEFEEKNPKEIGKTIDKAILILYSMTEDDENIDCVRPKNFCDL